MISKRKVVFILLGLVLLLSACTKSSDAGPTEAVILEPSPEVAAAPPTPVPPTLAPPVAILLPGEGVDPQFYADVTQVVNEMASILGWGFEARSIDWNAPPVNMPLVVAVAPDAGLQAALASLPGTQFVVIGDFGLSPAENLTVIRQEANYALRQGFLAGYVAALQTDDWRVGVISVASEEGQQNRIGFLNGATYFCGLCSPTYPPYSGYPLFVELAPGAGVTEWQAAADQLLAKYVLTVYVAPGVGDQSLLDHLAQNGVAIIGTGTPPEHLRANWLASIKLDRVQALVQALPTVVQNGGMGQVTIPLALSEIDTTQISSGRQAYIQEIIGQLLEGIIDPAGE